MNHLVFYPNVLQEFTCLGAECEDTCCQSWGMQVDAPTLKRYEEEAPELMQSIARDGEVALMRRDAATDFCVKFTQGLCGIQKQYGENFLGDACYFYPRVPRKLAENTVVSASLSCPEITRLLLSQATPFALIEGQATRLPDHMQNFLPEGLSVQSALAVHQHCVDAVQDDTITPERALLRIVIASESLMRIAPATWPDAVPYYLSQADKHLPAPAPRATDPTYLLQAMCGLVAAAKKVHQPRLMRTLTMMQEALHVSIQWETLAFAALPDSANAVTQALKQWQATGAAQHQAMLRRYTAAQFSLALFPFSGFGTTMRERAAIIAIRYATIRLALICASVQHAQGIPLPEAVTIIQSISRLLDHLADPDFSLQIYTETGWMQTARLRGILEFS